MKFRNKFVSKRIGTKTLASLLAFGMALGSPMAVFADDGETAVVAENTVQAKKTDGSEVFVSVSDYVRGMMERDVYKRQRILWRRSKKNGMICLWINIQKRSH